MDSSFEGAAIDLSKCNKMNVGQKRELIYELSKESHIASELLQSWSRQEILEILCAEMGKERKYTGLTKVKIIEALLRIVSEKRSGESERTTEEPNQRNCKRQRKTDNPSRLMIQTNNASRSSNSMNSSGNNAIYCNNSACRATLRQEDKFCKRCSCCLCRLFDDNKDPSLWLTCSSEPPFLGDSCGLSCHLECAFKHENSGLGKDRQNNVLDGSFFCVSCGKVNDLLGCWKKQLIVAKDTRRVDILCYRLSLGRKLLEGTKKYQRLFDIVDEAVKKLEAEAGPLSGLPVKVARGIVNRLQSGPEVQKLCSFALESLEKLLSDSIMEDSITSNLTKIRLEDIRATSLTVILGSDQSSQGNILRYSLWHRKVSDKDYPEKSTCTLFTPNTRFVVAGLKPATEYSFKAISFSGTRELSKKEIKIWTRSSQDEALERSESPATNCSGLSNPSSVEDESNNYVSYHRETGKKIVSESLVNVASTLKENGTKIAGLDSDSDVQEIEKNHFLENQISEEIVPDNGSDTPVQNTCSEAGLPATPFRSDQIKKGQTRTWKSNDNLGNLENGGTSKKNGGNGGQNGDFTENGVSESDFEHCVKVIRRLECLGHVEKNFRQKFLTWYSLRASQREIRVVKVFIDTFVEDPTALAEQLVDTFSESVSSKESTAAIVPAGFCMKLWH